MDYKIASACIANRIKPCLSKIISYTQTGFEKGRYIGESSRFINDIIETTEDKDIEGVLLLLDFEKAFDSLEWSFVEKCLRVLGLSEYILNCFTTLYSNVTSTVENNGHLFRFFPVSCGVRQGDPFSPYIFILSIELLSAAIKYDPDVKGILLDNSEYVITQYADDSTLTLDNNPESLNKALFLIKIFGECSGLKANFEKKTMDRGKTGCGEEIRTVEPIIWNHEGKFKLLGIKYELLNADHFSVNFNEKLQSVQTLLSDW